MKINIHGSNIKVTEAIREYVETKIGKLNKYFENPDDVIATIAVKVRGNEQIIEVTIPLSKVTLRGEESNKDLYAAIDLVSDKIERQIRKNKTRMKKKIDKVIVNDFNMDFDSLEDEESQIVRRKQISMKPMGEEEAILQMNLLDHEFFVFYNIDTDNVCVIYRRKDGNYGIIETK